MEDRADAGGVSRVGASEGEVLQAWLKGHAEEKEREREGEEQAWKLCAGSHQAQGPSVLWPAQAEAQA